MIKKGVYHKLDDYVKASGNLAVKLYKEDIEAALRTKDFGGFELLSLCDYTGQSTATIGILDVFFDSKGLIEPEKFRQFCNSVVPLFKAKRIFKNTETLEAELDLYDFGEKKIVNPEVPMGFSSLMAAIVFIGGMLMIMLGLIGEYIGRIYISINNSPQYVIREETDIEAYSNSDSNQNREK